MKLLAGLLTFLLTSAAFANESELSAGDTAWVLVSAALVFFMLPGLALFYSGMVRAKNALSTMMYTFGSLAVIGVIWVIAGFSIAFGDSGSAYWGSFEYVLMGGSFASELSGRIPLSVFAMFQGMFAIITCALISGAVVERMKFSAFLAFISIWVLSVYAPIAHWVWGAGGWLLERGALDFAGGTVVHFSSGTAALALALVLGNRKDFMKSATIPHNVGYTLIGAGILWFGWFGFNAGSALSAGQGAGTAFINTLVAPGAAGLGWLMMEAKRSKPSGVGLASGVVAGLVAITPAAGFVEPWAAIVIGFIGGIICYYSCRLKYIFKLDESLDVFGIHGVGGLWGAVATGIFATVGAEGLILGNAYQIWLQVEGLLAAGAFSFIMALIIALAIKYTIGLRVSHDEETEGLDITLHGEHSIKL
jgi:Amt family ammonium transporter